LRFNNFCNTDRNKISKRPKEQALQDGSKEPTFMSNTHNQRRYCSQKIALEIALAFTTRNLHQERQHQTSAAEVPQRLQSITGKTRAAGCQ
jgi:hypothetical protein